MSWLDQLKLPRVSIIFSSLLVIYALSARNNNIWDCDESMNYWEPTHYLLHGYGLQTWEYSPAYGLRSYLYVGIHAAIGKLVSLVAASKTEEYNAIRTVLGLLAAISCTSLVKATEKKFGSLSAMLTWVFLAVSPGMFISVSSFLPSSFAMYCLTGALAAWMTERFDLAELLVALAAILGWPFSILVGLPIALDILHKRGFGIAILVGIAALGAFLVPMVAVDTFFYGKLTVAPWNIVDYNVLSKHLHGGSELYGVEPWYFYVMNCFLNFNLVSIAALSLIPVVLLSSFISAKVTKKVDWKRSAGLVTYTAGFILWFGYMSIVPHKEERFMFVIYPQLCLAASLAICEVFRAAGEILPRPSLETIKSIFIVGLVAVFLVLSTSRVASLHFSYGASMDLYQTFHPSASSPSIKNVCVGAEWYRFPGHFLLPENFRLQFVKSSFGGQLPQYFSEEPNGTRILLPNFNDFNREEPSRYVDLASCHFFIGQRSHEIDDDKFPTTQWRAVFSQAFLNTDKSPRWSRAFFVPRFFWSTNAFNQYQVLERIG